MIPLKYLLKDDDEDDQLIFKPALKDLYKLQCVIATGTREALKLLRQENTSSASYFRLYLYYLFQATRQSRILPEHVF